jgi:uncharacterized protein
MGHCDSPTQHGRDREFFGAQRRAGEAASARTVGREVDDLTSKIKSAGIWLLLGFVRCYQVFLGPFLGGACKFYPSCSSYAYQAIELHGAMRGIVLAMKRLGRCRPFTKGGFDPVPETIEKSMPETNQRKQFAEQDKLFSQATRVEQERAR